MPRTPWVRAPGSAVLVFLAVLPVLAGMAGCSRTPAAKTGTAPLVSSPSTVAVPDDLRSVIFDRFPATYIEEALGFDVEGPLDLAGAAKNFSAPAVEQGILRSLAFQRGYERVWKIKGQDRILYIFVLQMGSPKQALDYFDGKTFADAIGFPELF